VRTVWLPTYAFGAIGGGDLECSRICARRARPPSYPSARPWATLGVSLATLGVYTPREAKVAMRCQALILGALTLGGCRDDHAALGRAAGQNRGRLRKALAPRLSLWHGARLSILHLTQACPRGWAEIRIDPTRSPILAGAVTLFNLLAVASHRGLRQTAGDDQLSF